MSGHRIAKSLLGQVPSAGHGDRLDNTGLAQLRPTETPPTA